MMTIKYGSFPMVNERIGSDIHLEIGALMDRWQSMVNQIAQLVGVPCVLLNRLEREDICVLVANDKAVHSLTSGTRISARLNSYCSNVISSKAALLVENATSSCYADNNPTYDTGLTYYYGVPIFWPNREIFGTLCMLGSVASVNIEQHKALLSLFQKAIEYDLELLSKICGNSLHLSNQEQRFLDLFNQICEKNRPNVGSQSKLLQSELFTLLISQYQHWHHSFVEQTSGADNEHLLFPDVAKMAAVWSSLLALAKETEWFNHNIDDTESLNTSFDITASIEASTFKAALTLGMDIDFLCFLPQPLNVNGQPKLWSLLGLSISSFLLIGARGKKVTIHLSMRSEKHAYFLEWSLLKYGESIPLPFLIDNQSLFGFAQVCADLADMRLEAPSCDTDNQFVGNYDVIKLWLPNVHF